MLAHDHGLTRSVVLVGRLAIKLPQHRYGWFRFRQGLAANRKEAGVWRKRPDDVRLCPVLFALPGGLLLVQRRVDRVLRWDETDPIQDFACEDLTSDTKPVNFGVLDGRIVLLDYGGYM